MVNGGCNVKYLKCLRTYIHGSLLFFLDCVYQFNNFLTFINFSYFSRKSKCATYAFTFFVSTSFIVRVRDDNRCDDIYTAHHFDYVQVIESTLGETDTGIPHIVNNITTVCITVIRYKRASFTPVSDGDDRELTDLIDHPDTLQRARVQ